MTADTDPAAEPTAARKSKPLGKLDLAACCLVPLVLKAALAHGNLFTLYQVKTQDLAVLVALIPMLVILQRWAPSWRLPAKAPRRAIVLATGAGLAALLALGTNLLLWNFPVSRDEQMVVFDMAVYGRGQLATPLPAEWRDYAKALVPAFLLNGEHPGGLVSSYLPMNALLRLAFSFLADAALFNPLLALAGGAALFDLSKRLFAGDARSQWVVLLVYALSAQMLVNTMTTYAMTAHMALNLVWLAAFVRGGRIGHALAIAIGFVAVGLHQLAFHPLFVAPFLLWRLRQEGGARLVLVYGGAYLLILGWWIHFPHLAAAHTGTPAAARDDSDLVARVMPLLVNRDPLTLSLMMLNLVRFVAWQHLALLPLFLAAAPVAWRSRGIAAPMIWGIALGTLFIAFVLPFQGHGWGYRYLHPYLGSFALLAGLGYQRLAAAVGARAQGIFLALSFATLVGAVPLLVWKTRQFTEPHVVLDRHVAAQRADFVIIDTEEDGTATDDKWAISAVDEVRNAPALSNRPLRFASSALDESLVAKLCRRGSISLVDWQAMHRLGFGLNVVGGSPRFERLKRIVDQRGCRVN